jgi:hypothetical protein
MPLLQDGNVIIAGDLYIYGNIQPPPLAYGQRPFQGSVNVNSNVYVTGNLTTTDDLIAFDTVCDGRLKDNVFSISSENSLEIIRNLRPVDFTWNTNSTRPGLKDLGFIAQEVESVEPRAVRQGEVMSLRWERILTHLVAAVQELDKKISGH